MQWVPSGTISRAGSCCVDLFMIVLPFLGVLTYLILNHAGMAERGNKEAAASQAQFDD